MEYATSEEIYELWFQLCDSDKVVKKEVDGWIKGQTMYMIDVFRQGMAVFQIYIMGPGIRQSERPDLYEHCQISSRIYGTKLYEEEYVKLRAKWHETICNSIDDVKELL